MKENTTAPLWGGIILGGGHASRMGTCKLLLPLHGKSALEHGVEAMREGGVHHIVVVSGRYHQEMAPGIQKLGAHGVFNPRYEEGMFTSVQEGLKALPNTLKGCFILPGDIPMVKASTYHQLSLGWQPGLQLVTPSFRGKPGHPPLVEASLIPHIIRWKGGTGLRGTFKALNPSSKHLPVADKGILLDMDTPEEYDHLQIYAEREGLPTKEECFALWDMAGTPEEVRLHCKTVQAGVVAVGMELLSRGHSVNVERLATAALLHDICKGKSRHAQRGGDFLKKHGFGNIASLVEHHMDLPERDSPGLSALEEEILYCVDKHVDGKKYMPLEERWKIREARFKGNQEALRTISRRMERARQIRQSLERRFDLALEPLLERIHPWA